MNVLADILAVKLVPYRWWSGDVAGAGTLQITFVDDGANVLGSEEMQAKAAFLWSLWAFVYGTELNVKADASKFGANVDFLPSVRIFLSFLSSLFRAPPRQICEKFLRPVTPCSSFAPFRVRKQGVPHVGPGTVRACRALLEPAGPRGSDGAPPRRG